MTRATPDAYGLWRATGDDEALICASVEQLAQAFQANNLSVVSEQGFCLEERGPDGVPVVHCFDWYGREVDACQIKRPAAPPRHKQGQLLTKAIDSGISRCRWHRVRIEADTPPGTSVSVAVATTESQEPRDQGVAGVDASWSDFDAGLPHPNDWQQGPAGSFDFLVDLPPGRYLFVRLR